MSATSTKPTCRGWFRTLLSGAPHQVIGSNTDGSGEPYLRRWYLIPRNRVVNVYLHQFLRSDEDRALHNHPWWFISLILHGGYYEITESGSRARNAGSIAFRPAKWSHRVELDMVRTWSFERDQWYEKPCWTLIVTGPRRHRWGFWCKDFRADTDQPIERFVPWQEWGADGCGETA